MQEVEDAGPRYRSLNYENNEAGIGRSHKRKRLDPYNPSAILQNQPFYENNVRACALARLFPQ